MIASRRQIQGYGNDYANRRSRPGLYEFAETGEPMFKYGTVTDVEAFIDESELIKIELANQTAVLTTYGWDGETNYCEIKFACFRAYYKTKGILPSIRRNGDAIRQVEALTAQETKP